MSYIGAVNIIRDTANAINPNGTFEHCRTWDASLEFNEADCQIFLYPLQAAIDITNHFYESWQVVMAIYFQDSPDSTNEERENIVNSAFNLAKIFLSTINENELIEISGIRTEPNYRQLSGTYTGITLTFTMGTTSDLCATDEFLLNTNNFIIQNTDGTPLQNT